MKRRLSTILSALSLVLCVGSMALMVRSHWRQDGVSGWTGPRGYHWHVYAYRGGLHIRAFEDELLQEHGFTEFHINERIWRDGISFFPQPERTAVGFSYSFNDISGNFVGLPFWFLAIVFSMSPCGRWLMARHERRRRDLPLCPTCGYDLRASKDRCPECGAPIPVQTASEKA